MGIFKKVERWIGGGPAAQMEIDTQDRDYLRKVRDTDPTAIRRSTEEQLKLLETDKTRALDELRAQSSGLFASQADQAALSGGLSSGASERIARQGVRQGAQNLRSGIFDFARQGTALRGADFADQEQFRQKAAFGVTEATKNIQDMQAANLRAREFAKQAKRGRWIGLGMAGVSAMTGNPAGAKGGLDQAQGAGEGGYQSSFGNGNYGFGG
jgi:hypothetical protein